MIKYLKKEYRRRRILRDIKKAKRYFQERNMGYMCNSFVLVDLKYYRNSIIDIIPEFNQDFLDAQHKQSCVWWDIDDRESRIKAFDKLIEAIVSNDKTNVIYGQEKILRFN